MSTSHEQSGRPSEAEFSLAELAAAAAQFGMRLVAIDTLPESEPLNITTREEMLEFAVSNQYSSSIAFRGWKQLQKLYAARVQYETIGLKTSVSHYAKLLFLNTEPIPEVKPEVADNWVGWRQRLTDLDVSSFQQFVMQLNSHEALLGYRNGQTVHDMFKDFAQHLANR